MSHQFASPSSPGEGCCLNREKVTRFLDHLASYQGHSSGVDALLKTSVYTIRLFAAWSENEHNVKVYNRVVGNINFFRPLLNATRVTSTAVTLHGLITNPQGKISKDWSLTYVVFLFVKLFLNVGEQLSNDLICLCNYWLTNGELDANLVTWRFRFFKSFGHTAALILELLSLVNLWSKKNQRNRTLEQTTGAAEKEKEQVEIDKLNKLMFDCLLRAISNLCDMSNYFVWYGGWKPSKTTIALCGIYGGVFGGYLTWQSTAPRKIY